MPIAKDNFDLSAVEFRDGLCLRYRKPMLQLPPNCDGCGAMFSINHALDCRRGGLVVQQHNEIRDVIHDLSSLAWGQTVKEPIIHGFGDDLSLPGLKADIGVRGVWQPQAGADLGYNLGGHLIYS